MKTRMFFALLVISFFSACAVKEITHDFDMVTGENFIAPLNRYPGEIPSRVLMLPLTGLMQVSYKQIILNDLMTTLHQGRDFLIVSYNEDLLSQSNLKITIDQAMEKAKDQNCDAVLYLSMMNQSVYPPLRLTVKVLMTDVHTKKILLDGMLDYDTQNELICNSARRFYQTRLQKTDSPEKSLSILSQNQLFLRFIGYDVGKAILRAFSKDFN